MIAEFNFFNWPVSPPSSWNYGFSPTTVVWLSLKGNHDCDGIGSSLMPSFLSGCWLIVVIVVTAPEDVKMQSSTISRAVLVGHMHLSRASLSVITSPLFILENQTSIAFITDVTYVWRLGFLVWAQDRRYGTQSLSVYDKSLHEIGLTEFKTVNILPILFSVRWRSCLSRNDWIVHFSMCWVHIRRVEHLDVAVS